MPDLAPGQITVVELPPADPITVVLPVPGPRGPAGTGAGGGLVHQQTTPSASWSIPHQLGRLPVVDLYVAGELVEADVAADVSSVHVTFPTPTSGFAVLV